MKKILIANRGEIACRIIDSCKKLNLHSYNVSLFVVDEMINLVGCSKENFKKLIEKMNYKILKAL